MSASANSQIEREFRFRLKTGSRPTFHGEIDPVIIPGHGNVKIANVRRNTHVK